MKKTYTVNTELGFIETPIAKEAIKLALRNRVEKVIVTFEDGIKYCHNIKVNTGITVLTNRLNEEVENFVKVYY